MKERKIMLLIFFMIVSVILFLGSSSQNSYAIELIPDEAQYLELKLVSTEPVEGAGTQVILELWAHNLEFKGFDLRMKYDAEKVSPSNISTNIATNDLSCFTFENGFEGFMDIFQPEETQSNVVRCVCSLNPKLNESGQTVYDSTNEYLVQNGASGDYVTSTNGITDGVAIGKFSFILNEGTELDENTFTLATSETNSPLTGIKIAKTSTDYYSNISTFRTTIITTGTVSGSITTSNTKSTTGKNTAAFKFYKSENTSIDWDTVTAQLNSGSQKDNVNSTLNSLVPEYEGITNDDGTYSAELEPGSYVLLIDKPGYLDLIYKNVNIVKGENTVIDNVSLVAGDIDKNGIVNNSDIVKIYKTNGKAFGETGYTNTCDFNDSNKIDNTDIVIIYKNNNKKRNVI